MPEDDPRLTAFRPDGQNASALPVSRRGEGDLSEISVEAVRHLYRPARGKPVLALDDVSLLELVRNGYMGPIYAHLLSLANIPRLARRLDQRLRSISAGAPTELPPDDERH